MRLLFAAPDRDLIRCYETLLAGPERTVVTAFDGVQVLRLLAEGDWDLLILSRDIPRIAWRKIVEQCSRAGPPVLVLTAKAPTLKLLLDPVLANDYLPLPFLPGELEERVEALLAALASPRVLRLEGREIPAAGFRLGTARLTLPELRYLEALLDGAEPPEDRMSMGALNEKLAAQGFLHRIRYKAKEGYRLVTEHE